MRISESILRKLMKELLSESLFFEQTDYFISRGIDDVLDGSIDFRTAKGDLLDNIVGYIKNDIENYCFTKVVSVNWSKRLYGGPNAREALARICIAEHLSGRMLSAGNYVEGSFEVTSYPMTRGEQAVNPESGLTKYEIQNKLSSARVNNEFSCQEFKFKSTNIEFRDFSIMAYREESKKRGESKVLLDFVRPQVQ